MTRISRSARLAVLLLVASSSLGGCRTKAPPHEEVQPVELERQEPAPPPTGQPDPRAVYHVPLRGDEPQKGPDDALFTIVSFGDYQCPFCKRMEPVLNQLLESHPEDIRVVWMHFPLPGHRDARPAATASLEAQAQRGDEGFWQMHDKLFANQQALGREDLERYAKELGLNMRKFRHALDTDKYSAVIDRQVELGNRLGFPGTPAFYLNGRFIPGLPLATWEYALKLRRPLYEGMLRAGVPKEELYDTAISDGKRSP